MEYKKDKIKCQDFTMPYLVMGKGKKDLVIIPGISLRPVSSNPEAVAASFEKYGEDYTIYFLDRKEDIGPDYKVEQMADDTIKAIREVGLKRFSLYGASQGGIICQYMALKVPEMVEKMVLASSCSYIPYDSYDFFDRLEELVKEGDARSLVRYLTSQIYSKEFYDKYLDLILKAYGDLSEKELISFGNMAADRSPYLLDKLNKIRAKTLLVAAKGDKIFGIDPTLQMALKMDCECVIYDGYSHAVYDEAEDFRERMFAFLG